MGPAGMKKAVAKIAAAANAARMPMMVLVSSLQDAAALRDIGATAYVTSNDQNFLKAAAKSALDAYCDPKKW